jgi:transposase
MKPRASQCGEVKMRTMYHDGGRSELVAYGHSKDHRPELAQAKVVMEMLDSPALPNDSGTLRM